MTLTLLLAPALISAPPPAPPGREVLDRFLKAHPQHLEARVRRLVLLREAALRRTGSTPLGEVADLETWGPFVQDLDTLFRQGHALEADLPFRPEAAEAQSPLLRFFRDRHRPAVDAALARDPQNLALWRLRAWMGGPRGVRALLAGLPPPPHTTRWPAPGARELLVAALREAGAWEDLRRLLLEDWQGTLQALATGAPPTEAELDLAWRECLGPLLEACQRTGDTATPAQVRHVLGRQGVLAALKRRVPGGATLPPPALAKGPAGTPSEDPASALRTFLGQHPERQDVRADLLAALLERTGDPEPGSGPEDPWTEAARVLDALLVEDLLPRLPELPRAALQSPAMAQVCARHLEAWEARLRRQPSHPDLWRTWLDLAALAGGRSLPDLLDRLVPLPGTAPWPPEGVLPSWCRSQLDGGRPDPVRRLLQPRIQARLEATTPPTELDWRREVTFLLEAHLHTGDLSAAERLLATWIRRGGWSGARGLAAALAAQAGHRDLAQTWQQEAE